MRSLFISAVSLIVFTGALAYAAEPVQNVKPMPVAGDGEKVKAATPDTKANTPEIRYEGDGFKNMKLTKDTGGKSTSSMIANAPLGSDYVMGKKGAPIVMVEYASLSCPHCAHFSSSVLPELQKNYIETGKVLYVLRQYPLNEPALKGAMLLDCVGEQDPDKYYVFAKVLFDAQSKWAFDGNFLSGLETIATVGGLTKEQFRGCVNNTDREMKLLKQKKTAEDELQIPYTPYIYIDGEVFDGERDITSVSKFIDAKLATKKKH